MFGMAGWMELGIIAAVVVLLFGKRIPESMRSLGKGIVEFKKGIKDINQSDMRIHKPTVKEEGTDNKLDNNDKADS